MRYGKNDQFALLNDVQNTVWETRQNFPAHAVFAERCKFWKLLAMYSTADITSVSNRFPNPSVAES
jgi:hypothetical protein